MIRRIGANVTAALVAPPLPGLASSLLAGRGERWQFLVETQLNDIVADTAVLLPTYIIGYAYADLLAFAGPLQSRLRAIAGWQRGD